MKTNTSFLTIFLITILFFSCENDCIDGVGEYASKTYEIESISNLNIAGFADVYISKGTTSLQIEVQQNVLDALNVNTNTGTLEVGLDNCFRNSKKLKVYWSTPDLTSLTSSGLINIESTDTFKMETFEIIGDGDLCLSAVVDANEINCNLSGFSDITLKGNTDAHYLEMDGLGTIQCYDLYTETTNISLMGAATAKLYAEEHLNIRIEGSGEVYYKGNPTIQQEVSGLGKVVDDN